jgi:signal transduction histidine kinase
MEKPFSWRFTLLPIAFIIVTAVIFSSLHILELQRDRDEQIEKVTTEFIDQQKKMAKNRVMSAAELISFQANRTEELVRKRVKDRVDEVIHIANAVYEKYHGSLQEKDLKEQLKLILANAVFDHPDGYFFAVDMDTEKIIVHQLDQLLGYSMSQHKDLRGQLVLTQQKKLLSQQDGAFQVIYFSKPTEPDREFPKQLYIRYFKPFNWLIGTGEYLDDMEKRLQKSVLDRFQTLQSADSEYLFIQEIYNLEGHDDKPYGAKILSGNPMHQIGQPLLVTDQDSQGNYYSKEVLNLLRNYGEGFVTYWYPSPEHGREVKKTSFFFYHNGWKWAIGSGFYYDSLDKQLATIEDNINQKVMNEIWSSIMNTLLIVLTISAIFFVISRSMSNTVNAYSAKLQHSWRKTEQALAELKRRNKALEQFNYAVSHELKTPLVSIESSLGLIQSSLPQNMDPGLTRYFGYARNAARQMNHLLDSLLLMFRIDTTDNATDVIEFRVIAQEAVDRLAKRNLLQDTKVTITEDGPVLKGDRDKLVQIWQHLVENAVRYMGDQQQPAIDIGVEQTDQEMLFYVRDNGIGIEQQYQNRIFGLFDQLDKNSMGNGLGLTLVQRIVEFYGGTIRVESAGKNQGCCFYFTLPDALS